MPSKADTHRIFTVRLERETVERLTRLAGKYQEAEGSRVTVSELVRYALEEYLKDRKA